MSLTDQVCRIQFIPKNQDTFRAKSSNNTIAQYLNMNEFTIGCSRDANIIYKTKGIHSIHLRVVITGREIFVEDVFSKTGVTINGKIIKPGEKTPYRAGEFIQLGNSPDIITVEMFRKPVDPRVESDGLVLEAEKKANEILKEANEKIKQAALLEEKSLHLEEEIRKKFESEFQARIDELEAEFQQKEQVVSKEQDQQAKENAQSLIDEAQAEVHKILMEARNQAEDIKQEAEQEKAEALELKKDLSEEKGEVFQTKNKVQVEIEELEKEKEQLCYDRDQYSRQAREAQQDYEKIAHELQSYRQKIDEEKTTKEQKLSQLEQDCKEMELTLNQAQQSYEEVSLETKSQQQEQEQILTSIQQAKEELQQVEQSMQQMQADKQKLAEEVQEAEQLARSQINGISTKVEKEINRRKKEELDRLQLIRDREKVRIYQTISDISGSVSDELEFELLNFDREKHRGFVEKAVRRIVIQEFELREKMSLEKPKTEEKKNAKTPSKIKKWDWNKVKALPLMGFGLLIGLYALQSSFSTDEGIFSQKRSIQSVSSDWHNTYTDNMLYTENYLRFTKLQKTNKRMKKQLERFLRKEIGLSKDEVIQFYIQEGALIWELKKIKKQSRSDSAEQRIVKMESKEKELRSKLFATLGGREQFKRYFDFQRQQFIKTKK